MNRVCRIKEKRIISLASSKSITTTILSRFTNWRGKTSRWQTIKFRTYYWNKWNLTSRRNCKRSNKRCWNHCITSLRLDHKNPLNELSSLIKRNKQTNSLLSRCCRSKLIKNNKKNLNTHKPYSIKIVNVYIKHKWRWTVSIISSKHTLRKDNKIWPKPGCSRFKWTEQRSRQRRWKKTDWQLQASLKMNWLINHFD